jgi:hypothetical protein
MITIGYVYGSVLDAEFSHSLMRTVIDDWQGRQEIKDRIIRGHAPAGCVHMGRNFVVREFLKSNSTYLIFVDTDQIWEPNQFWALVDSARKNNLAVVCAPVYSPVGNNLPPLPLVYDENFRQISEPPGKGIQQVFGCGSGFICIRRDVYEQLGQAYPTSVPYYNYEEYQGPQMSRAKAVSEDVIFHARCHRLGIPTYVNWDLEVGHRKLQTVERPVPRVFA